MRAKITMYVTVCTIYTLRNFTCAYLNRIYTDFIVLGHYYMHVASILYT